MAKQFPNTAEAGKTSKESVSIEQGQPLRAAEPDQCALKVRTKPIPETPTQRERDIHELTNLPPVFIVPSNVCWEGQLTILIGEDRIRESLDWMLLHSITLTFSAEVGVAKEFKVLVSYSNGSIVPMEGPKDVTEYMVPFVCDMLETWGSGVCILKCQNDPAEIALQNAVVRTGQFGSFERWCVSGCSEIEEGNFVNKLVDQARGSSGMGIVIPCGVVRPKTCSVS